MISDGSVNAKGEMMVGVVLRPIEANRLRWMVAVEINVSERGGDLVDLRRLRHRIEVERLRHVEMGIGDELVHDRVINKNFAYHKQTLNLKISKMLHMVRSFFF